MALLAADSAEPADESNASPARNSRLTKAWTCSSTCPTATGRLSELLVLPKLLDTEAPSMTRKKISATVGDRIRAATRPLDDVGLTEVAQ